MIGEKNILGFVDPRSEERQASEVGVQALNQSSMRLAGIRRDVHLFKTKDLVGLLLSHGARTWRNTLPVVTVRLRVFAPNGKTAVKIGLK